MIFQLDIRIPGILENSRKSGIRILENPGMTSIQLNSSRPRALGTYSREFRKIGIPESD